MNIYVDTTENANARWMDEWMDGQMDRQTYLEMCLIFCHANKSNGVRTILSRAKVYRHGFMVISYSKLIKKQKQKKILKLDQIVIQWYKPEFSISNRLEMTTKTKLLLQMKNIKKIIFLDFD